jgi:hypothetical protein
MSPKRITPEEYSWDPDPTGILQDQSALDPGVRNTPDNALEDDRPLICPLRLSPEV